MKIVVRMGRLIHKLQKERDMTVLYIGKLGPGTRAFLLQNYEETDDAFAVGIVSRGVATYTKHIWTKHMGRFYHISDRFLMLCVQSKGAKIRNRYNQVPHLTEDTYWKVTNSQLDTTNEGQEVSPSQHVTTKTVLYIGKLGPGTKAFLLQNYEETDDAFAVGIVYGA